MGVLQAQIAGPDEADILRQFGLDESTFLGGGGESRVFALDEQRVLRIFHGLGGPDPIAAALTSSWDGVDIGIGLPVVLRSGRSEHQGWSVDRRVPGVSLMGLVQVTRDDAERRGMLLSMLDAASRLGDLPIPAGGYRRLFDDPPQPAASLVELLDRQISAGTAQNWHLLAERVPGLDRERERLLAELADREVRPAFVHADVFPGNVMSDPTGHVTGVVDISGHALAADPVLDQVGAICLLGDYPECRADSLWLADALRERLGARDAWLVDAYSRFYGFYYTMDDALIEWAAWQFGVGR